MKKHWRMFTLGIIICISFVGLIAFLGGRLDSIKLLPDQGASWYYWKLPEKEFWSRFTAWAFYLVHQILVWVLIFFMQFKKTENRKKYRTILIFVNILFIALHILQTHIWYDGLAQDVPVMSSQGSVIIMLVLILAMETQRRGLFFGKNIHPMPKKGSAKDPIVFIRKYHGYFIAWAIVYTFWYHPTISTSGHLVGFFYLFLLFLQLTMAYTPVHTNKYWTFALEVIVLLHGTLVAIGQQNNMWPMFLFGFATIMVVTQIYGLKLPKKVIYLIQGIYVVGVIVVFGGFTGHREIQDIHQILWIPIIEYLFVMSIVHPIAIIKIVKLKISQRKQKNK